MKETFYFSHDYNAQWDTNIEDMRYDMWWEWYGIYWALVERLAQDSSHKLPTNYKRIAFSMQSHEDRIQMVVENYKLFEVKNGYFWSNRLLQHFAEREEKKKKAQESAQKRWQPDAEKNAVASQTQCWDDAIKERKGKERKLKEKRIETITRKKLIDTESEKLEVCPWVLLTPDENEKVKTLYWNLYTHALARLSSYKLSKWTKYKSDYATLHTGWWVYRAILQDNPTLQAKEQKKEQIQKKYQEDENEIEDKRKEAVNTLCEKSQS